jgi:rod shape-determining protein MreC
MLGGFIFLFAPQRWTDQFQFAFDRIFSWPLSMGRNISLTARVPPVNVVSRREYNQLQNHLANVIKQRDQAYEEIKRLSALSDKFPLGSAKLVSAGIIRASIDKSYSEFTINRGANHGLTKGQFILGDNSIIGTISDVSPYRARVKLITSATSEIQVTIAQSNVSRLMKGTGSNSAKIPLIPLEHTIKVGDVVYARKEPGLLEAPIIIARVTECKKDDGDPLLWDITVEPICDIERLRDVAAIVMNPLEN